MTPSTIGTQIVLDRSNFDVKDETLRSAGYEVVSRPVNGPSLWRCRETKVVLPRHIVVALIRASSKKAKKE